MTLELGHACMRAAPTSEHHIWNLGSNSTLAPSTLGRDEIQSPSGFSTLQVVAFLFSRGGTEQETTLRVGRANRPAL